MKTIGLIESSNIYKLRIEKLFKEYHLSTEKIQPSINFINNFNLYIKKVQLLLIDMDAINDMPGEPFLHMVKNKPSQDFPLILLCNHVTKKELVDYAKLGIEDIIMKPFSDLDLMAKVLKYTSAPTYIKLEEDHVMGEESHNLLVWHDELSVQDPVVDGEHKMIIEKFNHLYNLMKSGGGHAYYPKLLEFLKDYIETHFTNEEALQSSIGFPLYEEHKILHRAFTDQIKTIIENQDPENVTNKDLISINLFLKNWLLHHILTEDVKISRYMEEMKSS